MANSSLKNRILGISPFIEIVVRHLYWTNIGFYNKHIRRQKSKKIKSTQQAETVFSEIDFSEILKYLKRQCRDDGDSLILHSSYGTLAKFGMSPEKIIESLIGILGERGTLSMPAMPIIRNAPKLDSYLKNNGDDNEIYKYSVQSKRVKTGALGAAMLNNPNCVRSLHPINTMASIGFHSENIMKHNIDEDDSLPCGKNSSWSKCADLDSLIVGIGIDLTHSLTMIHVAEDAYVGEWPLKNWYRKRNFIIKNNNTEVTRTFKERRPKWGALHFAERTLCRDLLKQGVLHSTVIHGVTVEYIRSKDLLAYLDSRNAKGYPYFLTGQKP